MNNYFNVRLWDKRSFTGAILCVITVILILFRLLLTIANELDPSATPPSPIQFRLARRRAICFSAATAPDDSGWRRRRHSAAEGSRWVTVLSDHPQISPTWWWDNEKNTARKTLQTTGWRRSLLVAALASCDKTNVNSTCDLTDLDQIGPISVRDV